MEDDMMALAGQFLCQMFTDTVSSTCNQNRFDHISPPRKLLVLLKIRLHIGKSNRGQHLDR